MPVFLVIMKIFIYLCLSGLVVGGPIRHGDDVPVVTVTNGSYAGIFSPRYHQDFFLGVPFPAQRFRVAERLSLRWNETRPAATYPPHCYGYGPDNLGYEMSEDCLYLNIVRPSKISSDAQLPVAIWIHGGGLVGCVTALGLSALANWTSTWVAHAQMGKPIIGVSLNYRLVAFGFLGGQEAQAAGVTNIGFRDQRLAIEWIHENIRAFGGSPENITIWGESSGAESVTAQVLHNGLFRGAIGQSGFGGIIPRLPGGYNATALQQEHFDNLVRNVSTCASTVGTPHALECLRNADFRDINATLSQMPALSWPPVLDGEFLADYSANQVSTEDLPEFPF
ncbi:carboxylesterase family protein [Pochonia chlamydosporia 170]|uniref:Carboxylic ester hydrolase n=1 Tax=Pochonia chlamydosporia 170 TaxID=1380566 RepID=A0A219ANV6_METCM|nr:carboxylesterase family protein [Pochonia chlamydosporia 170]OWT42433.1 carboxylesterase family protein [Pochonia chlamydosporia 170]